MRLTGSIRILESGHDQNLTGIIPQDVADHAGTTASHAPDAAPAVLPAYRTHGSCFRFGLPV